MTLGTSREIRGVSREIRGVICEKSNILIFWLILGQIHVYAGRGIFKGGGSKTSPWYLEVIRTMSMIGVVLNTTTPELA